MSYKTKIAILIAIFLWASAFVGIRAGLMQYSPEGLALLRYLVAACCMSTIYFCLPQRNHILWRDKIQLLLIGVVGIGVYNLVLNYGEQTISSGMSSFIISLSPLITAVFALFFLGEKLTAARVSGFAVSVMGVILIAIGEEGSLKWSANLFYILFATVAGSCYSILQKPFLKKYHAIETTTFAIWGGALFLLLFSGKLHHDFLSASFNSTMVIIYLGIFPAALGYLAWGYVLTEIPAARAASFLYFMPFVATFLGWLWLHEAPAWIALLGGLLAIVGVVLVNQSYRYSPALSKNTEAIKSAG